MENKVKIVSLVSGRVVLSVPELRLKRVWDKKGAVKIIPFDQLQEALYEPGVTELFEGGCLGIDDMEQKIALGLEPEGAEEPVNIITIDDAQRKRYLTVLPFVEFKEKIKELPREQIEEFEFAKFGGIYHGESIENSKTDFSTSINFTFAQISLKIRFTISPL